MVELFVYVCVSAVENGRAKDESKKYSVENKNHTYMHSGRHIRNTHTQQVPIEQTFILTWYASEHDLFLAIVFDEKNNTGNYNSLFKRELLSQSKNFGKSMSRQSKSMRAEQYNLHNQNFQIIFWIAWTAIEEEN